MFVAGCLFLLVLTPTINCQNILCVMTHCLSSFTKCSLDPQCMEILTCLGSCDPTDAQCGFQCGMGTEAGANPHFVDLVK